MFYEEYERKRISAEDAAKLVHSGDWVDYGWCACHTRAFDRALAARAELEALQDIKVRGGVLMWMPEIFKIKNPESSFYWNSWHFSGLCRKIAEAGKGYYASIRYSEVPRYYRENLPPIDVAVCQVTPMDQHGYFNFSVSTSHQRAVFDVSKIKILEVNANLPVCLGGFENVIHISEVDFILEGDNSPMAQLTASQPCETDAAVAKLVLEEIPSGACLQLGIGGMPNAVGSMIAKSDLKDLGVHTEMYVDAFVDMAMAGKITGAKKNIDKGRQSFAFAAGTEKTYKYLHQNPACMACPVDYTNDPCIVGQLDNFISINSCVEVDLFGQVNSESSGFRHISGTGGQLDFVMGAYRSKNGKSFVCMTSTYDKHGAVKSRVVPALSSGSIVTDPRASIQWIVTEHGKINLKGMSTWERAEALIGIAAPVFREDLIKQAETMKIWRKSNKR